MYIITHPGKSHTDDRMSVSLILAHFGIMPVYRRIPEPHEFENANVFILDIGCRHDPVLRNFDHHQLDPDADPDCALSLLIKSGIFGELVTNALLDQPWLMAVATIDSKGPDYYAKAFGLGRFPFELEGPAELALQKQFELATSHANRGTIIEGEVSEECLLSLQSIGMSIIGMAVREREFIEAMLESDNLIPVGDMIGFRSPVEDRRVNERFASEYNTPALSFSIYPSNRGPGWRITRMNDSVPLNFQKVKDDPRVSFAHSSGFTLETKENLSEEECVDLVTKSLVEEEKL